MIDVKFEAGELEQVDGNTEVAGLFPGDDASFDAVVSSVQGRHPAGGGKIFNTESERAYYVLSGSGKIYVGEEVYSAEEGEMVYVDRNTGHAVEGDLKLLTVTSPPFSPENEEIR